MLLIDIYAETDITVWFITMSGFIEIIHYIVHVW